MAWRVVVGVRVVVVTIDWAVEIASYLDCVLEINPQPNNLYISRRLAYINMHASLLNTYALASSFYMVYRASLFQPI